MMKRAIILSLCADRGALSDFGELQLTPLTSHVTAMLQARKEKKKKEGERGGWRERGTNEEVK